MREDDYTPEEKRVSDYIQKVTGGVLGSGDDPVGFLISSHNSLLRELNQLRNHDVPVPAVDDPTSGRSRVVPLRPRKP